MNWCLRWWSPDGWVQELTALLIWGAVAGSGIWAWTRRNQRHQTSIAARTQGVGPEAGDTSEQAPRVGAQGGSTR